MICPECNSEMSRKWRPKNAAQVTADAVVWACGVCGTQLTQADIKLSAKARQKAAETLSPIPTIL